MSRIGKKPVAVPAGVSVAVDGSTVTVKGPKGLLVQQVHPDMKVTVEGSAVHVERPTDARQHRALHGLTRSLINNMVIGVTQGYSKTLEITGTGYRAELQGKNLVMSLGFSHPVVMVPPDGIIFEVNARTMTVTVSGFDKQLVGQMAANVRGWRPVEPYLGKGIRYQGESVRRKVGKAGQK